ncbi:hypothetical protein [Hydrogenophaga sp. BPS33]|uniref:hypothetical protein n=1 Tax=Hydrogenophaga sp. BPS33 TaxID=2651974 RepID=UPI0019179A5F|nr:hypothetical protein [Hydrogenophaga sp. BPS33]
MSTSSTFRDIRNGLLIGAVATAILIPAVRWTQGSTAAVETAHASALPVAKRTAPVPDFGTIEPTPDARALVRWIAQTNDNLDMPFVLVDKRAARVHVFNAAARLEDSTPVLLGSAPGDDSVPGVGEKPVHEVQPHERTTPAGRFVAHLGHNLTGEDVVWVDYGAAVSMHRVRPHLVPQERRAQRLASETVEDNRISYGCINVPATFFEHRLLPVFSSMQAVVYVLPEEKSLQQVFGASLAQEPPREPLRVTRSAGFV